LWHKIAAEEVTLSLDYCMWNSRLFVQIIALYEEESRFPSIEKDIICLNGSRVEKESILVENCAYFVFFYNQELIV
jgi:hypothetical protein